MSTQSQAFSAALARIHAQLVRTCTGVTHILAVWQASARIFTLAGRKSARTARTCTDINWTSPIATFLCLNFRKIVYALNAMLYGTLNAQ